MTFTHYDQSSWTADRVKQAAELGPPKNPVVVALPGAKVAISHDELTAHQADGLHMHEIVDKINKKWRARNANVLAEHERWATGPYREGVDKLKKMRELSIAEDMRRRMIFEQIVRERVAE